YFFLFLPFFLSFFRTKLKKKRINILKKSFNLQPNNTKSRLTSKPISHVLHNFIHRSSPSSTCAPHPQKAHVRKHAPAALPTRRQCLLLLTAATTTFKVTEMRSRVQDIPLFGLRQGLRKAEQEAEQIVKKGFEAAEKGVVTVEKGIEAAEKGVEASEKGIEAAEREIETVVSFGGLAQAGAVAGAEVVGALITTSVVNGILGPETQKS
ncbi:hypothetical protein PHJA_002214800, partial [Phtheirospermum japonicum]